jgi:hypothetical protein
MKKGPGKPPAKKAMRVAMSLTGVAACGAAFAPAAAAQAAQTTHALPPEPRLEVVGVVGKGMQAHLPTFARELHPHAVHPDASVPAEPFSMGMYFYGASKIRVCGWHPPDTWRCTNSRTGLSENKIYYWPNIGGNHRSWDRGVVDVYWNGGGPGNWDTCNTNGAYLGYLHSSHYLILGSSSSTVGPGQPQC